jgi:heme-degrading monooxygenase HmoA
MHVLLWSFRCRAGREADFDSAYGPAGDWASLFATDTAFLGTELMRGSDGTYLTVDRWTSADAFASFLSRNRDAYEALDARCESLTESETPLAALDL